MYRSFCGESLGGDGGDGDPWRQVIAVFEVLLNLRHSLGIRLVSFGFMLVSLAELVVPSGLGLTRRTCFFPSPVDAMAFYPKLPRPLYSPVHHNRHARPPTSPSADLRVTSFAISPSTFAVGFIASCHSVFPDAVFPIAGMQRSMSMRYAIERAAVCDL